MNLSRADILNRIAYFMNLQNISAYQMSLKLGHSRNYFYRVESGEIQLTVEVLLEVLEILNLTTSEFFYPEVDKYKSDMDNLKILNRLNEEEKKSLLTLLKKDK